MLYNTVLIDPPWSFATYSEKGKDRSDENHYNCMTLDDIKSLNLKSITTKDAVCLMWCTNPHLEQGMECLKAWGFKYKSMITWVKHDGNKLQTGCGYHTRSSTELLLIATRGKGYCPPPAVRLPSGFLAPRTKHSAKPDEQYKYAENYLGPYCEIFARRTRPGWTSIGYDMDAMDIRESLQKLAEK